MIPNSSQRSRVFMGKQCVCGPSVFDFGTCGGPLLYWLRCVMRPTSRLRLIRRANRVGGTGHAASVHGGLIAQGYSCRSSVAEVRWATLWVGAALSMRDSKYL